MSAAARKTPKKPRPLVLAADLDRVQGVTVLLVRSPRKRKCAVEAIAYVVSSRAPAEGEAFRLHKLGRDVAKAGDVHHVHPSADAVRSDCQGHGSHRAVLVGARLVR
jgi:hypothetical protein